MYIPIWLMCLVFGVACIVIGVVLETTDKSGGFGGINVFGCLWDVLGLLIIVGTLSFMMARFLT